jgi:DNA mismatch endonuclease (patch repair protein)
MDRVTRKVRSKIMASVRTSGGTTERKMEKILRLRGLRGYRKQWPVTGKPDFAWPKAKLALFVDGCFWHGCPRCDRQSKSNSDFWKPKIVSNRRRDRRVSRRLRQEGWSVLRVWECRISEGRTLSRVVRAVGRGVSSVRQPASKRR